MTKPLTKQVAKEYGWGKRDFTKWARDYISSLKVEERVANIKPIEMWEGGRIGGAFTKGFEKYIIDEIQTKYGPMLILNPNHIYILKEPSNDSGHQFYIPVAKPFKQFDSGGMEIKGLFYLSRATYTLFGLQHFHTNIIGILNFAPSVTFINWNENPFDQK